MTIGDGFETVLTRAQAGDHAALTTIYEDVAPLVLGYLRGNRAPEPEDIAGEVFVTVVQKLGTFTGDEQHFRSWLLMITHRRMIDDVRKRVRRPVDYDAPEAIAEGADTRSGSRAPEVELTALSNLETDALMAAIDELSPDQRAVVMLRLLADLPVGDTAEIVDKTQTAVKALTRRAVQNLRKSLRDRGIDVPSSGGVAGELDGFGARI